MEKDWVLKYTSTQPHKVSLLLGLNESAGDETGLLYPRGNPSPITFGKIKFIGRNAEVIATGKTIEETGL